jgi:hypothetical protein
MPSGNGDFPIIFAPCEAVDPEGGVLLEALSDADILNALATSPSLSAASGLSSEEHRQQTGREQDPEQERMRRKSSER